jgi:hypothetical protein
MEGMAEYNGRVFPKPGERGPSGSREQEVTG